MVSMAPGTSRKSAAISRAVRRGTQVVDSEQTACLVEFDMMADGCEQILNLAVILGCIANAIGCDHRQAQGTRNADGCLIPPFFFALPVALQFDVNILVSEDARQLFDQSRGPLLRRHAASAAASGPSSPPVRQTRPEAYWLRSSNVRRTLALGCFAHLELRNELAEILIAFTRCA